MASTKNYASVQVLRGLAALLVVVFHAGLMADERFGEAGHHLLLRAGAAGVDIFFPISGFVMVVSTVGLVARCDAWWVFAERRIIRIVPLYWLATTLKLALIVAVPSLALHTKVAPWHLVASYLFIFAANPEGEVTPVLPIGWTLNFEMFFYAVFAAALLLRAPLVRAVAMTMLVVAAAGLFRADAWSAPLDVLNPLVLEFVAGMLLARMALAGHRVGRIAAVGLGVAALAGLVATDALPAAEVEHARLLLWGVPGAALLLAAISLEPWVAAGSWRLPRLLGDASYSLYLSHTFVVPAFGVLIARVGFGGALGAGIAFVSAIAFSVAVGIAIYLFVERPITRGLIRWRLPRPVAAAAG